LLIIILFYVLRKERKTRAITKKGVQERILERVPEHVLDMIYLFPVWLFFAALMLSGIFIGIRSVPVSVAIKGVRYSVIFDLNIAKIIFGIALVCALISMLRDSSRRVGGWLCLILVFVLPSKSVFYIDIDNFYYMLPNKMFYVYLLLSCWFLMTFYSHHDKVPAVKTAKAFLWMAIATAGLCAVSIAITNMKNYAVYGLEYSVISGISTGLLISLFLFLSTITFTWVDVFDGMGSSAVYAHILHWGFYSLISAFSFAAIWGYVPLIRKAPYPVVTEYAVGWVSLCACFWMVGLYRSMRKYRRRRKAVRDTKEPDSEMPIRERLSEMVFKVPVWLALAALPMYAIRLYQTMGGTVRAFFAGISG